MLARRASQARWHVVVASWRSPKRSAPASLAPITAGGTPEELYDVMELNVNKLMPWGCGKSGIGANYKCLLCRIEKMTEEELAAAKAKELLRKNLGNGR